MGFIRRHRPSPALAVASLALFVALGGTSYAVITVGSAQIIDGSVRSIDVKNNAVSSVDIKNGSLRAVDFRPGELTAGPAGPRGLTGAGGAAGPQGPTGSTGATGATGSAGSAVAAGDLYARIDETGAIDATRTAAGIASQSPNLTYGSFAVYCLDLPQPVVNVSATVEDTSVVIMSQVGFTMGPLNATVVPSEIAAFPCTAPFTDAAVLVPSRSPGTDETPLYLAFL